MVFDVSTPGLSSLSTTALAGYYVSKFAFEQSIICLRINECCIPITVGGLVVNIIKMASLATDISVLSHESHPRLTNGAVLFLIRFLSMGDI